MTLLIPTREPVTLTAGDSATWTRVFSDYPIADDWVLSYAWRGVKKLDTLPAWITNDGTTWTVQIPATATKALERGNYRWAAYMTLADERHTVASGILSVFRNLAQASDGEVQSEAERILAACNAELERRITGSGEAFSALTIRGRSITLLTLKEIRDLRAWASVKVARERNPNRLGRVFGFAFRRAR